MVQGVLPSITYWLWLTADGEMLKKEDGKPVIEAKKR
jgi:hypothetical protein